MLNHKLLKQVKLGFVPQPGGQAEPVAGAGPMTAGMVAPMGGDMPPEMMDTAMGGDPMMGGDPSMGMPPEMMGMDPMMGMPPPGMDPAMAGAMGGPLDGANPDSTITLTIDDLIKLFKTFSAAASKADISQPKSDPKLDEIIALLRGGM